jgi:hypothetical protein
MIPENLARHNGDANMDFWKVLKTGSDIFELTKAPPKVDVCDRRYVFDADSGGATFNPTGACPQYSMPEPLVAALQSKQAKDEADILAALTTIEAKATAEAEAAQIAAAKAAEKERLAAERAANPSLVSRLLSRVGVGGQEEPPPNLDTAPVASVAPVSVPQPQVMASAPVDVPSPRLRPGGDAPATTPPVAAAAVVAPPVETTPPPAAPVVVAEPPVPAVGTFVKKKFLWPGEEDPAAPPG